MSHREGSPEQFDGNLPFIEALYICMCERRIYRISLTVAPRDIYQAFYSGYALPLMHCLLQTRESGGSRTESRQLVNKVQIHCSSPVFRIPRPLLELPFAQIFFYCTSMVSKQTPVHPRLFPNALPYQNTPLSYTLLYLASGNWTLPDAELFTGAAPLYPVYPVGSSWTGGGTYPPP